MSDPAVDAAPGTTHSRVLVVDDDLQVRSFVGDLLSLEGHEPVLAASGDEALRILGRQEFDLVLTDWKMQGMNGVDLARRVRERKPLVPVVLMSGMRHGDRGALLQESGASAFLEKPLCIDGLLALLRPPSPAA